MHYAWLKEVKKFYGDLATKSGKELARQQEVHKHMETAIQTRRTQKDRLEEEGQSLNGIVEPLRQGRLELDEIGRQKAEWLPKLADAKKQHATLSQANLDLSQENSKLVALNLAASENLTRTEKYTARHNEWAQRQLNALASREEVVGGREELVAGKEVPFKKAEFYDKMIARAKKAPIAVQAAFVDML